MGVNGGSGLPGAGLVRRSAATALGACGRLALTVAERVGPDGGARTPVATSQVAGTPAVRTPAVRTPAVAARGDGARLDARTAAMAQLRKLALDATLAAANDPGRPAGDRLGAATDNMSEWAAGRLLSEAERMRQLALALASAGSGDGDGDGHGAMVGRRQFDLGLRRQFPWLDDASVTSLFDHAVLVSHRMRGQVPVPGELDGLAPIGRFTALVSRLRSKE